MRRISILILGLFLLGTVAFAQTGLQSTESTVTGGLFTNELDTALNVMEAPERPAFEDLGNAYLFAGLSNLWNGGHATTTGTQTASAGSPLWIGFYLPGDMPFSNFTGVFFDGTTTNSTGGTVNTTATKAVTVAGPPSETTNHTWVDQTTVTEYSANRSFDRFVLEDSFVLGMGNMNLGAYIDIDIDDNSTQANNYTITDTFYYDSDAGDTTVGPNRTLDYTRTRVSSDITKTTDMNLLVPVAIIMGDMQHYFSFGAGLNSVKIESSNTDTYSGTPDTNIGGVTDIITDSSVDNTSTVAIDLDYMLQLPALFGEDSRNRLNVGFDGGVDIKSASLDEDYEDLNKTYAGGGAAATNTGKDIGSAEYTTSGAMDIDFGAMASHSFYFSLGPVDYAFEPEVNIDFSKTGNVTVDSVTFIWSDDVDGDGSVSSATDQVTTQTYTFTNNTNLAVAGFTPGAGYGAPVTGNNTTSTNFTVDFDFPIAAEAQIANWPFKFAFGSTPTVSMTVSSDKTSTATTRLVETVEDGQGATASTDTTQAAPSTETTTFDTFFTVSAAHSLGLLFDIGENVQLDTHMDLSTGATNVLDFTNLTVEMIIALP